MYRDWKVYIEDIVTAVDKIERYIAGYNLDLFLENSEKQDAVIRNLEIIGEAAGKVPDTIKENCQNVEWRKIVGLRNILIHEYFGVRIPSPKPQGRSRTEEKIADLCWRATVSFLSLVSLNFGTGIHLGNTNAKKRLNSDGDNNSYN
jgi:uncharacterized protein with HEPN domain